MLEAAVKRVKATRVTQTCVQKILTHADQICPTGEWIERTCDCVIAWHSLRGRISQMKVVEDFESRPHKAVSFVVEEVQEWTEQKMPWRCLATVEAGCHEEAQKKETKEEEDSGERQVRNDIAQEVVAGMKKKASAYEEAKPAEQ